MSTQAWTHPLLFILCIQQYNLHSVLSSKHRTFGVPSYLLTSSQMASTSLTITLNIVISVNISERRLTW